MLSPRVQAAWAFSRCPLARRLEPVVQLVGFKRCGSLEVLQSFSPRREAGCHKKPENEALGYTEGGHFNMPPSEYVMSQRVVGLECQGLFRFFANEAGVTDFIPGIAASSGRTRSACCSNSSARRESWPACASEA